MTRTGHAGDRGHSPDAQGGRTAGLDLAREGGEQLPANLTCRRTAYRRLVAPGANDQMRESELLAERVDPIAREVSGASDPWDAYAAANRIPTQLLDDMHWLPHGGEVYVAWAVLTDLYETGKTPIPDAHAALRRAADDWVQRSDVPTVEFIEGWLARVSDVTTSLFDSDGDWWRSPSQEDNRKT